MPKILLQTADDVHLLKPGLKCRNAKKHVPHHLLDIQPVIFERLSRKVDGFVSVEFPLTAIICKEFPLLGIGKHCVDGKVLDINVTINLAGSCDE